jgi:hypothetical protein
MLLAHELTDIDQAILPFLGGAAVAEMRAVRPDRDPGPAPLASEKCITRSSSIAAMCSSRRFHAGAGERYMAP